MKREGKQNSGDPHETKHLTVRVIAFALVFAVALGCIGFGVSRLGHKEPGYYEIEADASDEVSHYADGFAFLYRFDGTSSEIKAQLSEVKDIYNAALMRSYKLLDTETAYEGYVNLATLNENLGQPVSVSEELFAILTDAWAKTQEGRGFSMFAGALYDEWYGILSLDDISEFDPAVNADSAARIHALARETADLSYFSLAADPSALTVTVSAAPEYTRFLRENEYSERIVSMNVLEDAYRLSLIRDALEARGYLNGYLYTDSGLTLSLSEHEGGAYALYSLSGETVTQYASVTAAANSACSFLRVFPMLEGEIRYHAIAQDGGTRYYHPNFATATGDCAGVLMSSCAVRGDGDIVGCCYENFALYNLSSRAEIFAAATGSTRYLLCFPDEQAVYTGDPEGVTPGDNVRILPFPEQ